jgi:uncharacterized membrane protein
LKKIIRQAAAKLSGIFLRGLAITLPLTLTVALLYWLAMLAEESLGGLIRFLFPNLHYWPGMGLIAALAIVLLAGMLMSVWFTRRAMFFVDRLLDRIPLVKSIYGSLRDIAMFLSKKDSKSKFKKVVAVRVAEEMRLIGFVTVEDFTGLAADGKGKDQSPVGVYLPMSYQIGGFMVFVPSTLLEPLEMSVEDAMRFILTAGVSGGKANGKTAAA